MFGAKEAFGKEQRMPFSQFFKPQIFLIVLALCYGVYSLGYHDVWWDEGWTLAVAKTWITQGRYGIMSSSGFSLGQLSQRFTVVAPTALSFRLFGTGIEQARLPGLIYLAGALTALHFIAFSVFSGTVALGALVIALFSCAWADINPVLTAVQVIGEMPAACFLCIGYAFLICSYKRPFTFLPPVSLFWGLALYTKPQPRPFLFVALIFPVVMSLFHKRSAVTFRFFIAFAGSIFFLILFNCLHSMFIGFESNSSLFEKFMYEISAFNFTWLAKERAFDNFVISIPHIALGLSYCMITYVKLRWQKLSNDGYFREMVGFSLCLFCLSWIGWFLAFSVGWSRYLAIVFLLGSIHCSKMIYEITDGFRFLKFIEQSAGDLGDFCNKRRFTSLTKPIILLLSIFLLTNFFLRWIYPSEGGNEDFRRAITFLNKRDKGAVVETYESELFFLLEGPYHYPPDYVHVKLNEKVFLKRRIDLKYNPLAADPDYLVEGQMEKMWKLYDNVIKSGDFKLLKIFGRYTIYKRVRTNIGSQRKLT